MTQRPVITIMREEDGWTVVLAFDVQGVIETKETQLVHSFADVLELLREHIVIGRLPISEWNEPPMNPMVRG